MGPTPPGFGEYQEALSRAASAMSPATRDLPVSGSVTRQTPTSISIAPCLTMSAVTMSGTPAAATITSALRVCAARSAVPVWHSVTVALTALRVSSRPMVRPTVVPRPTTTTSLPRSDDAVPLDQLDDALGRARQRDGDVLAHAQHEAAQVGGVQAVGVLVGVHELEHPVGVDACGQRQLHDEPRARRGPR